MSCPTSMLVKRKRLRSKALTDSAKGETCTIRSPYCKGGTETTVGCHSPEAGHGKGMGEKADDFFLVYGCYSCHSWMDNRMVPSECKSQIFPRAHRETIRRMIDKGLILIVGYNA